MDVNELGARGYYYGKASGFWVDECAEGEITEEQLERQLDNLEEKSTIQLKRICKDRGLD